MFITEKCQFRTENCQFETEKCQLARQASLTACLAYWSLLAFWHRIWDSAAGGLSALDISHLDMYRGLYTCTCDAGMVWYDMIYMVGSVWFALHTQHGRCDAPIATVSQFPSEPAGQ